MEADMPVKDRSKAATFAGLESANVHSMGFARVACRVNPVIHDDDDTHVAGTRVHAYIYGGAQVARAIRVDNAGIALRPSHDDGFHASQSQVKKPSSFFKCCGSMGNHYATNIVPIKKRLNR